MKKFAMFQSSIATHSQALSSANFTESFILGNLQRTEETGWGVAIVTKIENLSVLGNLLIT